MRIVNGIVALSIIVRAQCVRICREQRGGRRVDSVRVDANGFFIIVKNISHDTTESHAQ